MRGLAVRHPRQIDEAENLQAMIMRMIGYVRNRTVASCDVVVVERMRLVSTTESLCTTMPAN